MRPSLIQCLQIAALVFWTITGLQLATLQAARLLAYDPQLGSPVFEAAGVPVYPFWRIVSWRFAFGEHAPTTFAAVCPSVLFGIAAGASHAFVLLFVPDASVYRDPLTLSSRPPPRIPWRPSPNARLSRLIAHAEAEVHAAKRAATARAVRAGEAEAAERLAAAERATKANEVKPEPTSSPRSKAGSASQSTSEERRSDHCAAAAPDADPNQLALPLGGGTEARGAAAQGLELSAAPPAAPPPCRPVLTSWIRGRP